MDVVAAHQAADGGIGAKLLPNEADLLLMSPVEGVVFTDNPDGFQKIPSFTKFFLFRG